MKTILITKAAFVFGALFFTTGASAEPVNWTITTPFDYQTTGIVTGSFTFDADTGKASNEMFFLSYKGASPVACDESRTVLSATGFGVTCPATAQFSLGGYFPFASSLTDAGGTVNRSGGTGGLTAAAAAPEPQSYALGLLGLAALGTARAYPHAKPRS